MVLITQKRLITTVSAFVSNMADLEAYKEAGVENVRFCAVHDLRTSAICQKHDRKVVPISKAVAGVNIPPMHPHCRSTIEPVIDEEIENNMKQRVRNPYTGRDEIVSANETYDEWYERIQKEKQRIEKDKSEITLESPLKVNSKDVPLENLCRVSDIVNKKEYHDKFETLPFAKSTREGLYKNSIELLKYRNGTGLETAYAINYKTDEFIVSSSTDERLKSAFNAKELLEISRNVEGVVVIHNHPFGGRLSMSYLRTLYKYDNYKAILSIGHNGDIYCCIKNNKLNFKDVEIYYENVYNDYVEVFHNKTDASIFALDDVYKNFDLRLIDLSERS